MAPNIPFKNFPPCGSYLCNNANITSTLRIKRLTHIKKSYQQSPAQLHNIDSISCAFYLDWTLSAKTSTASENRTRSKDTSYTAAFYLHLMWTPLAVNGIATNAFPTDATYLPKLFRVPLSQLLMESLFYQHSPRDLSLFHLPSLFLNSVSDQRWIIFMVFQFEILETEHQT